MMIERDEAVVESDVAIGKLEIIDSAAGEARLDEIFEFISPITETAAKRKRQVQFVEQFVARHEGVQDLPGVAELGLRDAAGALGEFASRPEGAKFQEWPRGDERITGRGGIKEGAAQQDYARLAAQLLNERFGRVLGGDFMDERAHVFCQLVRHSEALHHVRRTNGAGRIDRQRPFHDA